MFLKRFTGFNRSAVLTISILGFWVAATQALAVGLAVQSLPDQKGAKPHPVMMAQNEAGTTPQEKTVPPSDNSASESENKEKTESAGAQEKPLKQFRPTERIEAEQAVDFPYDI